MNSFEKLDVPIYAKPEEIQKAYENRLNNLKYNKELFSESLYQRKIEELDIAKQECFEAVFKPPVDRLKIYAKDAYKKHMSPNVLHASICGDCCYICCGCCSCNGDIVDDPETCDDGIGIFSIIIGIIFLLALTIYCVWYTWKDAEDERNEQSVKRHLEKLKRDEKKELNSKTKEIKKQNKNIDRDIARYKKLCRQSSCTNKKIKPCKQIVTLLEKMGDEGVNKIKKSLSPYQKCAEEKAEIESKVENIAQLYRDIGNTNAADELLSRLQN